LYSSQPGKFQVGAALAANGTQENLFQSQFLARCGRRAIAARVGRLRLYAGAQLLE